MTLMPDPCSPEPDWERENREWSEDWEVDHPNQDWLDDDPPF